MNCLYCKITITPALLTCTWFALLTVCPFIVMVVFKRLLVPWFGLCGYMMKRTVMIWLNKLNALCCSVLRWIAFLIVWYGWVWLFRVFVHLGMCAVWEAFLCWKVFLTVCGYTVGWINVTHVIVILFACNKFWIWWALKVSDPFWEFRNVLVPFHYRW